MRRRSSNPIFESVKEANYQAFSGAACSYTGVAVKMLIEFLVFFAGTMLVLFFPQVFANIFTQLILMIGGIALIFGMMGRITSNPSAAKTVALGYSLILGLIYGDIIIIFEAIFPGIVLTAALGVAAIFASVAILYGTGIIKNGPILKKATIMLSFGYMIFIGFYFLFSLFNPSAFGMNPSTVMLISLISCALATLFLVQDVEQCNNAVKYGAPKEFEWMLSLGLMTTLIWLFVELLQILALFRSQDN